MSEQNSLSLFSPPPSESHQNCMFQIVSFWGGLQKSLSLAGEMHTFTAVVSPLRKCERAVKSGMEVRRTREPKGVCLWRKWCSYFMHLVQMQAVCSQNWVIEVAYLSPLHCPTLCWYHRMQSPLLDTFLVASSDIPFLVKMQAGAWIPSPVYLCEPWITMLQPLKLHH